MYLYKQAAQAILVLIIDFEFYVNNEKMFISHLSLKLITRL